MGRDDGVLSTVRGKTGNACMLCATAEVSQMVARREVSGLPHVAGTLAMEYSVKTVAGDGGTGCGAGFSFEGDGGQRVVGGSCSTAWLTRGNGETFETTPVGSTLTVYWGGEGRHYPPGERVHVGDCVAIDDLSVTYFPKAAPP